MACRIAFLSLLVLLACSNEESSQNPQDEPSGKDDVSVEDGIKTIGEYGKWALQGFVDDPIEESVVYLIMTHSDHYRKIELIVDCSGFIWIQPVVKERVERRLLLNYLSSSESHLAYSLRTKWGSGMEKRIDKIWAQCERNTDCQILFIFPYKEGSFEERLTKFNEDQLAEVAPSLKDPMTTYDTMMLEVKVIQDGSEQLNHYTFDLNGFTEGYDALLAKGCKPIPPLTALKDLTLHTLGAVSSKRGRYDY